MNVVHLIGGIGRKPEIKQAGENKVCTFSLATSEKHKSKEGEVVETTTWHNIVVWGKQAEIIEKYCEKGSKLQVTGKITNRSYDDKDGVKRYVTEIIASSFEFLSSGNKAADQGKEAEYSQPGPTDQYGGDGLPF